MLKKISRLKKFGIFHDFSWDRDTPDFAKFNLIYGWNRSGKTTLSRVFAACEKGTTCFDEYPSDGEFEIKVKNGADVTHNNCQSAAHPVRVFNRDFVKENVFFNPEGSSTNPITYVGKEEIESAIKLRELRETKTSLTDKYNAAQNAWEAKTREEDRFRITTARLVKNTLGTGVNTRFRFYDKGNLNEKIRRTGIENFNELSQEDYDNKIALIRSEQPGPLILMREYSFDLQFENRMLRGLPEISEEISALLTRSVVSETINRLENDDEINRWAEEGFRLHAEKDEKEKCLFCQNKLKAGFLESLSRHFSEDYSNLQKNIDSFIHNLKILKKGQLSGENRELSKERLNKYKDKEIELNALLEEVNAWIDIAIAKLSEKRGNPLLTVNPVQCPKDFGHLCNKAIQDLNSVIEGHNRESRNHAQRINEAEESLENHIIASAIKEERYEGIVSSLSSWARKKKTANNELDATRNEISRLEQKTSEIGGAVDEINRFLEEFFGSNEIVLELDYSKEGYVIIQNGKPASTLSEGEKNAIAFSYFIVKTREMGFDTKEGIIVIDDPVSSFDSNFTYRCCVFRSTGTPNPLEVGHQSVGIGTVIRWNWDSECRSKFSSCLIGSGFHFSLSLDLAHGLSGQLNFV